MKLPLYVLDIDESLEDETSVFAVGLVLQPAIERNWHTFSAEEPKIEHKFTVIDEEKRILGGFLMVAEQPIYRRDEDGTEYYVKFTAESIARIVNKLAKSGKPLSFNLNHDDNQPVKGAYLLSHFIIDSKLGMKTPDNFTPAPDGSWFGYVKIEDESVWQKAKDGDIRGFSVEGYFNDIKIDEAEQTEYEELKNKIISNMEFNKLKKVLGEDLTNQLKKVFSEETPVVEPAIEFVETSLLDGSAIVKGTIAVGETVTLVMPDGSEVPAPDGEHTLEGNVVITVMGGVIEEVATAEEESPLIDEALMSKVNEALEAQANDFNNQIADIHSKYASEIEALNAKATALFSAVGILAKTEEVEEVSKDAKRKSASVSASQFSRLTEILNKIK
jgi:hypothetical protein